MEFEHLTPIAAGGQTIEENLWLSCRRCNEFKGTQTQAVDPETKETQEYLREPELLAYFPKLTQEIHSGGMRWKLRIIPHAHLRMVQRGFTSGVVVKLFVRFVEYCVERETLITPGAYTIFGHPTPRERSATLRVDVDEIDGQSGRASRRHRHHRAAQRG